ncbi:MAG: hypothetical protein VX693_11520 [Pseudomonadota bacterium]|nr:hypothetical protein [Pseudomonadota bacterium]
MRYDFHLTVWDDYFINKFIEFSLASQLANDNLVALAEVSDIHYHIYTARGSHKYFKQRISSLEKYAKVHFHFFDEVFYKKNTLEHMIKNGNPAFIKHNVGRVTAQHMLSSLPENSAGVFIDSDLIISSGTFIRMHELRILGKRAVLAILMRLNERTATPVLRKNFEVYLQPRNLVRLCIDHMHPSYKSFFYDSAQPTSYMCQINWRVKNFEETQTGLITHGLFPSPLMVIPDQLSGDHSKNFFSTMDYDYVLKTIAKDEDIYLSKSSDEIMISKMTTEAYRENNATADSINVNNLAYFIFFNTNIRHRLFFDQSIFFIANEEGNWDNVSNEAKEFIDNSYKTVERMMNHLPPNDPRMLAYLKSFLGPIGDFISPQLIDSYKKWLPKPDLSKSSLQFSEHLKNKLD